MASAALPDNLLQYRSLTRDEAMSERISVTLACSQAIREGYRKGSDEFEVRVQRILADTQQW